MRRTSQRATATRRDATGWPILVVFAAITACFTLGTWMWGRLAARAAEATSDSRANPPLRLRISVGDLRALPGSSGPADSPVVGREEVGAEPQAGVELRLRSSGAPPRADGASSEASPPSEVWVSEDSSAEVWIAESRAADPKAVRSSAPQTEAHPQSVSQSRPQVVSRPTARYDSIPHLSPAVTEAERESTTGARAVQGSASSAVRIVLGNSAAEEGFVLRIRPSHGPLVVRGGSSAPPQVAEVPLPVVWPRYSELPPTSPTVLRLMRENLELGRGWSVAGMRPPALHLGAETPRLTTQAEVYRETPTLQESPLPDRVTAVQRPADPAAVVLTSNQTDVRSPSRDGVSPASTVGWEWPGRTSTDAQPGRSAGAPAGEAVMESPDAFRLSLTAATAALRDGDNRETSERWQTLAGQPPVAVGTDTAERDFSVPLPPGDPASREIRPGGNEARRGVEPSVVGDDAASKSGNRTAVKVQEIPGAGRPATMTALQAEGTATVTPANPANMAEPAAGQAPESPFEIIEESGELTVVVRRSKLLRTKVDVYRTAVVDSAICDVVQFTPREISILGKSQGATHVTFWFQDERYRPVTYLVRVTPDPEVEKTQTERYELLESHLAKLFPESKVDLIVVGDKLVVKGQARDAAEAAQIMAVIRGELVRARGVTEGRAADPVGQEAAGQTLPAIQVINMLRIPGPPQVALKVKIAELNRTAARNFGVDMHLNLDQGKFLIESLLNISSGGSASVLGNFDGGDLQFGLHYLEEHGVVRLLSEPTLVTISGRPATFIAGGEFAVPTAVGVNGVGAVTTDFRAYGAIITFLPTVLDKDLIRLEVAPEFSQIDKKNTVNGTPGLRTRAVTTTVEMREGQTLAIAGLLDDSMTGNNQGDLPIFNQIFGRRSLSRNETELIILVTPEIVHPMEPEEVPPLPGFDVTEPTNHEFYIKGHLEGRPTQEYDSTTWPRLRRRYNAGGPAQISGPYGHGE